ncbi:MAG: NAD-glutamate dehydrogenase, partial [Nocardioidaceae bacterium]|nr:NAD-glutamate dehydrogenase [Nocardioidaceae bacterium]
MHSSLEQAKQRLLTEAAAYRESGPSSVVDADLAGHLLEVYYRHVPADDLLERSAADVYGAAMSHYKLAAQRPQGTAAVRVFTPAVEDDEWDAEGHTVIEVVTDDMPFLVDSVTMAITAD